MVGLHDAEGNESWRQNAGHGKQNAESLSETFTALRAFYDHGLDDDDDDDDAARRGRARPGRRRARRSRSTRPNSPPITSCTSWITTAAPRSPTCSASS